MRLGLITANPVDTIKPSRSITAIAFKYVLTVETIMSPFFVILLARDGASANSIFSVALIPFTLSTFPISTYSISCFCEVFSERHSSLQEATACSLFTSQCSGIKPIQGMPESFIRTFGFKPFVTTFAISDCFKLSSSSLSLSCGNILLYFKGFIFQIVNNPLLLLHRRIMCRYAKQVIRI